MQLIETNPGARELAGKRSRGLTSPARRERGHTEAPGAPRSFAARFRALRQSVWAPIFAKGLGLLAGMLALAAVGASSLSRGPGVPVTPAQAHHAGGLAASMGPLGGSHPAPTGAGALPPSSPLSPPPASPLETSDGGTEPPSPPPPAIPPSAAVTADGKIILNLAGPTELRQLPGVGAKRADAIVALRAKLGGRFKRVTDLLRVKGIGPKGLKKIEPKVVLDAPKAA